MPQHLVWLRTDLRILDNPALFSAAESGHVTALFLLTPEQWQVHGIAPRKIAFILRSLDTVSEQLAERGIETKIILSSRFDDAPRRVLEVATPSHKHCPRLAFTSNDTTVSQAFHRAACANPMRHSIQFLHPSKNVGSACALIAAYRSFPYPNLKDPRYQQPRHLTQ